MAIESLGTVREGGEPLAKRDLPRPEPSAREILVRVRACGVCHTELDEIEGRTPPPVLPVVPGHQVVGVVEKVGPEAERFSIGDRVGVAWIHSACGRCEFCRSDRENLCREFKASGRDVDGGYAEYMKVQEQFAYPIPKSYSDVEAAPLLCAGAIGYRSIRLAGIENGSRVGLTGFGASAHLVLKMISAEYPSVRTYVFARSPRERELALELGAVWAGDTSDPSPEKLDCVVDTTPVWKPVVEALKNIASGGRLIINAIRKEDVDKEYLSRIDYARDLWLEKEIKSVANVTRRDVTEFLSLAARIDLKPVVEEFPLEEANSALIELKERRIRGAKVLVVS